MTSDQRVAVVGTGKTRFGERFDLSYGAMIAEAARTACADAGVELSEIDGAWLGTAFAYTYSEEGNAGSSLTEALGLDGVPVTRVANYCVTGMDAIRQARNAVLAGQCRVALVVGCEKMRDVSSRASLLGQHVEQGHPIYAKGRTAPGMFGLVATRYAHVYGDPRPAMTAVSVKNRQNGSANPFAHHRNAVAATDVESARPVSGSLRLLDCCPTTDGAAAVVVTSLDTARSLASTGFAVLESIELAGSGGYFSAQFDPANDFLGFPTTRAAAARAYRAAGIADPGHEIDVAEVHDCFTITEVVNYEDLGLAERGQGPALVLDGHTNRDGRLPVNTSGGLQACGHPIGATGVRAAVDVIEQLVGRAGDRQVARADVGLAHTLGGPGSVACVSVLSANGWTPRA